MAIRASFFQTAGFWLGLVLFFLTLFAPLPEGMSSLALKVHPLALMVPATVAASCAFMLPISTPPNAVVFASGYITIPQMARAGFFLDLLALGVIVIALFGIIFPLMGITDLSLPSWAAN